MTYSRIGAGYNSYSHLAFRSSEQQTSLAASLRQRVNDVNVSAVTASGGGQSDSVTISNAAREALQAARMNTIGAAAAGRDVINKWRLKEEENNKDAGGSAKSNPVKMDQWEKRMTLLSMWDRR